MALLTGIWDLFHCFKIWVGSQGAFFELLDLKVKFVLLQMVTWRKKYSARKKYSVRTFRGKLRLFGKIFLYFFFEKINYTLLDTWICKNIFKNICVKFFKMNFTKLKFFRGPKYLTRATAGGRWLLEYLNGAFNWYLGPVSPLQNLGGVPESFFELFHLKVKFVLLQMVLWRKKYSGCKK